MEKIKVKKPIMKKVPHPTQKPIPEKLKIKPPVLLDPTVAPVPRVTVTYTPAGVKMISENVGGRTRTTRKYSECTNPNVKTRKDTYFWACCDCKKKVHLDMCEYK